MLKTTTAVLCGVVLIFAPTSSQGREINKGLPIPHEGALAPAVKRPSLDSMACRRLAPAYARIEARENQGLDHVVAVRDTLQQTGARHAIPLLDILPDEFAWWVHVLGPVDFLTLALAVHETSHAAENLLRFCGAGHARYLFDSRVYDIGVRPGEFPAVADIAKRVNSKELRLVSAMRSRKYFVEAPSGNDFSILLGELAAYVIGAQVELALLELMEGRGALPSGITALDGNVGGMVDMILLTKLYLAELEQADAASMASLLANKDAVCLLHSLHATASHLVKAALTTRLTERIQFSFGLDRPEALVVAGLVGGTATGVQGLLPARLRRSFDC